MLIILKIVIFLVIITVLLTVLFLNTTAKGGNIIYHTGFGFFSFVRTEYKNKRNIS